MAMFNSYATRGYPSLGGTIAPTLKYAHFACPAMKSLFCGCQAQLMVSSALKLLIYRFLIWGFPQIQVPQNSIESLVYKGKSH